VGTVNIPDHCELEARAPYDHRDIALEQLAADEAEARETNRVLLDLLADVVWENYRLRHVFGRVLRVLDDARLSAQRERDAVLAARAEAA
jgi:hypothetical protein